ncbi:hypothetical protein HAX54_037403 [Datura stramonium]|uniref:EF-hand domain-containing protein n=1 Tax=Datura stramonium TaxID=4076 RepID=A0ABS8SH48_DATST|nr:hypothetical protein [Datura stramonium]
MDHVLSALRETKEERDLRIRSLFSFSTRQCGLLGFCENRKGLLKAKYMDDKELELYRIFQAIDVEHNGCILPRSQTPLLKLRPWEFSFHTSPPVCQATLSLCNFSEGISHALISVTATSSTATFTEMLRFSSRKLAPCPVMTITDRIEIDDDELARFVEHVDKDPGWDITFKNGGIFFYFIHMRPPWRIFTDTGRGSYSIATAPLDRLKVVLQVQTTRVYWLSFSCCQRHMEGRWCIGLCTKQDEEQGDMSLDVLWLGHGWCCGTDWVIYPMDLVKTRLQTHACEGGKNLALSNWGVGQYPEHLSNMCLSFAGRKNER